MTVFLIGLFAAIYCVAFTGAVLALAGHRRNRRAMRDAADNVTQLDEAMKKRTAELAELARAQIAARAERQCDCGCGYPSAESFEAPLGEAIHEEKFRRWAGSVQEKLRWEESAPSCIGPNRGCEPGYQGGYHSKRCPLGEEES